jgi:GNAT superfamily N-acetyltransferase
MKTMEKTLEYHELLMNLDDTSKYGSYELPDGFTYDFYKDGDINDWVNIHISSGEFMKESYGEKVFHDFYDSFLDELSKRCFFVINNNGEKVGTATISKLKESEYGYDAVVDWFAIKKEYQGYHLSKPMINRFIKLANDLGYEKILLHTQTHTWLAAKLYLDLGFEPFNVNEDIKGWKILKTITNHPKLEDINSIPEQDMYFDIALKVVNELDKIYGKDNYEYSIWHINGRHDVEVRYNNQVYDYKYYDEEIFRLEKEEIKTL